MTRPASDKSAFANWLVAQRKSRPGSGQKGVMTTAEMRAAIKLARGFSMGHSTYAQLESGSRKPTAEQYGHITGYLGQEPPVEPAPEEPPAGDPAGLLAAVEAFTRSVDLQTQKLDRVWDRLGDLIERLDRQQPLTKDDAVTMAEGLADGIGASLSGAIADLADALRQPSPSRRGGHA